MDFKNIVFASDMDGTLLRTDKTLNPADIAALRRFTDGGGRFVIATGRPLHTVTDYADELKLKDPMILCNGGVIYDFCKGIMLYEADLPEIASEIIKDVRNRYPDISPEIYTFSKRYYFHMNTVEKWHQNLLGIDFIKVESDREIDEPWIKMLFADEIEVIDELTEYVKKYENSGVRFVRSFPKFLEILPAGISKGSALKELVDIMGLQGCKVAAAGDYDNDIEMLEAADISFCPSNSEECVKKAASVVLKNTNDEGAIAEAVKYLESL